MTLWLPGATRLPSSHTGQRMTGGPPRVVWHRTAGGTFESNTAYLRAEGFEPHLLWDPRSGQIGQFLPADVSAYALRHPSGVETNRMGRVCIQIEVADHGQTWDITSTPMIGWPVIRRWLRDLGIPEVWPGGPPPPLGRTRHVPAAVWASQAGHYAHSQIPGNTHVDPGRMDLDVLFLDLPTTGTTQPEEFVMATKDEVKQAVTEALQDLQGKRTPDHKDTDPSELSIADVLNKLDELPAAVATAVVAAQKRAAQVQG